MQTGEIVTYCMGLFAIILALSVVIYYKCCPQSKFIHPNTIKIKYDSRL